MGRRRTQAARPAATASASSAALAAHMARDPLAASAGWGAARTVAIDDEYHRDYDDEFQRALAASRAAAEQEEEDLQRALDASIGQGRDNFNLDDDDKFLRASAASRAAAEQEEALYPLQAGNSTAVAVVAGQEEHDLLLALDLSTAWAEEVHSTATPAASSTAIIEQQDDLQFALEASKMLAEHLSSRFAANEEDVALAALMRASALAAEAEANGLARAIELSFADDLSTHLQNHAKEAETSSEELCSQKQRIDEGSAKPLQQLLVSIATPPGSPRQTAAIARAESDDWTILDDQIDACSTDEDKADGDDDKSLDDDWWTA